MPVGRKTVIIVALTDVHIGSQFKENVAFNSRQIAIMLPIGDIVFLDQQ
jgi:hypothetical protein